VLHDGPYTGVNDVVMDPRNPDVLLAATNQRQRTVAALIDGGPESGIYKTTNAGQSWRKLETGLPAADKGRIGLAISPIKPDVVYATIELGHRKGGFWRSEDGGETWTKRNDYHSGGTGPHYYQEIMADPHHFDWVYQMDAGFHMTRDGGKTFARVNEKSKHGDNHALVFDPNDPDYLLVGTDGGLYESWDLAENWKYVANLPVTQFYKVALDNDLPFYNIYGGTQDNSTQGGPSRTDNVNGIRNSDWFITIFADGHQPAVDPENPDIVYSEWQQGNLIRYDRKTGEVVYIQPQPEPGDPAERWNWDSPILISPHSASRLYYASQRVWRSDDRGDSWNPVSGDLSKGEDRLKKPMMGRVWSYDAIWDLGAMSNYGSVTSLAESPQLEGLLYAGTDDGLIQVSSDGGESWQQASRPPGVGEYFFINDIKADLFDADSVYIVGDDHKYGDFSPRIFKSENRGQTWENIAGDLPKRHLVWRLVQDHVRKELMFAGTEFGIFFTVNGGQNWIKLTGGVPNIPFRDLAIQRRENDLVGASFGRGFFVLDDYTPLRALNDEVLKQEAEIFPVKKTWWYVPKRTLGGNGKASQGEALYLAPNPAFGAVFSYYLKDDLETRKSLRQKAEVKVKKDGGDTPYPGWDALRAEAEEETPAIILTVRDAEGNVVRKISGPVKSGFHRIAWDLRLPTLTPETGELDYFFRSGGGILAAPGTYSVTMAKRVDGVLTQLGESRSFDLVPLRTSTLAAQEYGETEKFMRQVNEFQRMLTGTGASLNEAVKKIKAMKAALLRAPVDAPELEGEVRELEKRLYDIRVALNGNAQKRGIGEPTSPSIGGRLQVVLLGNWFSTYGPTATHRRSFEIAQDEFASVRIQMQQLVDVDLVAFEDKLEQAGVPWTPGRKVPVAQVQ